MKLNIFLQFLGNAHDAWFEHRKDDKFTEQRGTEVLGRLVLSNLKEFQNLTNLTIQCVLDGGGTWVASLKEHPEINGCCGGRNELSKCSAVGELFLKNYERVRELGIEITISPKREVLMLLPKKTVIALFGKKKRQRRS